jgi:hypothetical protein
MEYRRSGAAGSMERRKQLEEQGLRGRARGRRRALVIVQAHDRSSFLGVLDVVNIARSVRDMASQNAYQIIIIDC